MGPAIFPSYLRYAFELSSGYSSAMGIGGPMWQFVAGAAGFVLLAGIALTGRKPFLLALAAAPCLLIAFGAWKHAMVRQDGHAAPLHAKLAVAALLLAAVSGPVRARIAAGYSVVSMAAAIPIMMAAAGPGAPGLYWSVVFERPQRAAAAWLNASSYWEALQAVSRTDLSRRTLSPAILATLAGQTVEAVPYSIDLIRANRLDWRPQPVIHTYSAYTPYLDSANAAHVAGPAGRRGFCSNTRPSTNAILSSKTRDRYEPWPTTMT